MKQDFDGARVVVTAGTRGIGRAAVLAFADAGARVYTCGRSDREAADSLAAELAERGDGHTVELADMADPERCRSFTASAARALGGIDVLVNNAAAVSHRTLEDMEPEEWNRILTTNLTSVYEVTRAALGHMGAGAAIVTVSSAVAMRGMAGRTHYTASKAALTGFTRSLCKEVGPQGIRANVVAPGVIATDQIGRLTPERRERYERMAALGRLGAAEDIAGAVLYLAGPGASYVTGQTLTVDGGI
ncbi:SDR family oxidoreductase [Nocardiopsis sp. RSe5-2]|uniref:SDR family oxidoreductase n=1 Tax=Nocardiopsis endophytica TaxID=3018445 RepID=A0ABT4U7P3_9ACTN|nr:SDR family oxidoreductase [Nocardiopsis endophytica]MDA2812977.1 SDR family oxidoreductase [Nocardiopsis endophytica]